MKLFVSHASEDKEFARELTDGLVAAGFEVWLDEHQLKLGDSILGKINEGLLSSDYGVVILSPTFFGKKWTRIELEGLMSLETSTRKMILPIWKDISAEEVTQLMPTIAGRFAALASGGIEAVVSAIRGAVGGAEHQREISKFGEIKLRLEKIAADSKNRRTADLLLNSVAGAKLIQEEFGKFIRLLEIQLSGLSSDELKFSVKQPIQNVFNVEAPYRLRIEIRLANCAVNSAAATELACTFYRIGRALHFGDREAPRKLNVCAFFPYFDRDSAVVWSTSSGREAVLTTEAMLATLAEKLTWYIERESRT